MSESLLNLDEILESTGGVYVLGGQNFYFDNVQTDSRNVSANTLFVPLIGEFQDGHKYIPQALESGASVVFIAFKNYEKDSEFFVDLWKAHPQVSFVAVENTMTALQKAAGRYVEKFPDLIKVAVTGSSGKTTTKEIIASVLEQKYKVVTNKGNFNSETGLPLSVFSIRPEHECGIFEMGMNRENEIGEISAVLKADYAVITNIGTAHIGILGSRDNIAKEKAKVFDYFNGKGTAVIPFDDDYTKFLADKVNGKVVYYGQDTEDVKYTGDLGLKGSEFTVENIKTVLSLPGKYNYKNALAAVALARVLGLDSEQISRGIMSLKPMFGRSQIIEGKYSIVQDCYNANPDSMEKAIEFVSSVKTDSTKVFVLGDMLELGEESKEAHEKMGKLASESSADVLIFVGGESEHAYNISKKTDKKVFWFPDRDDGAMGEIALTVRDNAPAGSIVLVKASRGMGLERVTSILEEKD